MILINIHITMTSVSHGVEVEVEMNRTTLSVERVQKKKKGLGGQVALPPPFHASRRDKPRGEREQGYSPFPPHPCSVGSFFEPVNR